MKTFCLAIDLKDDPAVIAEYEKQHTTVSPEIIESITSCGIHVMDIYRTGNRLFMIMKTEDDFSFEEKGKADLSNPKVQVWEKFMDTFQQRLPWAQEGEKWVIMKQIFQLP